MRNPLITLLCLIFNLTLISNFRASGQVNLSPDLFPPSPTATSFAKAADMPVNLYSGTPDISVPIYALKSRSLVVDVSLKYTGGSGIKVQEIAGPASLGWTLLAGGVITRTVRSKPDEEPVYGYCRSNFASHLNADVTSTEFRDALVNTYTDQDLEPDLFNSSIGGRITFTSSRVPSFLDRKGYVIAQNGLYGSDSTWVIVDTKGNKYIFGKNTADREHTLTYEEGPDAVTSTPKYFISSWFLSEIRSPEGETITFTYEKGKAINYKVYSMIRMNTVAVEGVGGVEDNRNGASIRITDPVCLKKIATYNKQMTFSYNDRWDVSGQKSIEKIAVADLQGNITQAFRFNHGYFSDGAGDPYARPKLLGIESLNNTQNKFVPLVKFQYNESEILPARSSAQFDHWGYYNNNTTGYRLKSEGAVKDANAAKCKAGVLTAIEWSTGGQTLFEYELNTFRKNNTAYSGGGLRISKIKQVEGTNTLETNYSYLNEDNTSSGLLQSRFSPDSGYVSTSTFSFVNAGGVLIHTTSTVEYDLPVFQLLDLNGVAVGYSRVVVTHPDQSKEVQLFQGYQSFPDLVQNVFLGSTGANSLINLTSQYTPNKYNLFNFYTPKHALRGLITELRLLKSDGGVIQKTNYTYSSAVSPPAPVGLQKKPYFTHQYDTYSTVGSIMVLYRETTDVPQLTTQKTTYYNSDNLAVSRVDYTRKQYHSTYPYLLSKETMAQHNGDSTVVTYRYPMDIQVEESDIGGYMTGLNIIPPVEKVVKTKSSTGELVNSAMINLYTGTAVKVRPSAILSLDVDHPIGDYQPLSLFMNHDSRCKPKITYDLYATSGELLQYHEEGDVPISVFWGLHHEFPVAKVVGAAYAQAATFVDTALLNSGTLTQAEMRLELDKLRQNLSPAAVTSYTYSPPRGLTSETDQSGRTQYFEYDEFSRLKNVKDLNGDMISNQDYHYKSAGGWKDTATKRCPKDGNGQYTGEEEVQQIDTALNSPTYNQSRWHSLGYTYTCNKPIYVKLFQENQRQMGGIDGIETIVDLIARFYEDAACTIPQPIRSINLSFNKVQNPSGTPETSTVSVHGTSMVILPDAVIKEQNNPGEPSFSRTYSYYLILGPDYIIVP